MNASRWPAKDRGYVVGIAGNQTARAGQFIRELHLPADVIATSDDWGAEKPAPAFFDKLIARAGMAPEEIAYLGDRLDNDILPAADASLFTVLIKRGRPRRGPARRSDNQRAG